MITERKADHIRINLEEDVEFPTLTTGLEQFRLIHQALPEMCLTNVDTSIQLFNKTLAAPILVSSMTGGTKQAQEINRNLAEAAQIYRLAMAVGSQRIGIEHPDVANTFRVRDVAPTIILFSNVGAVQFNYGYGVDQCRRAVEMIEADGLILHLNPLQEALQPDGDTNWHGLLSKIEQICRTIQVPVIVKEVGWGISERAARMLINAGVRAIDVAGAGGTSWSQVEMHRAPNERLRRLAAAFYGWGIPTAESLLEVRKALDEMNKPDVALFASGGIRTGQDIAKCLALGADLVGLASPFLKCAVKSVEVVLEEMEILVAELRISMFCCAAANTNVLRQPGVLVRTMSTMNYSASPR